MNFSSDEVREWFRKNPALAARNKGLLEKLNESTKAAKYHNQKTEVDGIMFDSRAEADRYCELKLLKRAGLIYDFKRQVPFQVAKKIKYIVDFQVWEHADSFWVEDVKGFYTQTSKLKAKLFREKYPDIELKILKEE